MAKTLLGSTPRHDAWEIIGPGGGGGQFNPVVSPHDPKLAFNRCDMGGAYVTHNGGDSWRMFNLRCWAPYFAFDPTNPDVVYGGNMGLWRSEDRGDTWSLVLPDPAQNTVEHWSDDHADVYFTSDDPFYPGPDTRIDAIAVHPSDPDHLYISIKAAWHLPLQGLPSILYFSPDRGKTWRKLAGLEAAATLGLHVTEDSRVFVAQPSGLLVCDGDVCTLRPGPEGEPMLTAALGEQDGKLLVYGFIATAWEGTVLKGGLYVSEDEGRTWRRAMQGFAPYLNRPGEGRPPSTHVVGCSSRHAATAYLGFLGNGNYYTQDSFSGWNGLLKTTDAGRTWQVVHREEDTLSANLEGTYLEPRAVGNQDPSIWFDTPRTIGVAPNDPDICFVTDIFRTICTRDGGRTWTSSYSVKVGENVWRTRGLDVTTCYGVHFDPSDRKKLFISYTDIGGFRSEDGGHSWIGATEGIPPEWRNTTYWVEYDPEVPGLLWGAFGYNHDLPRPRMWAHGSPVAYQGGVAVSTDHGATWTLSNRGMAPTAVTHLLLDPTTPAGRRTLYATGFGTGVWKSTDNGVTWALKNTGLEGDVPLAWRLTRVADGTLYLILARRVRGWHGLHRHPRRRCALQVHRRRGDLAEDAAP